MARMVGYARAACASFVLIPLFGWAGLRHPWIAMLVAVAALAEAAWFSWRAWHGVGRLSRRLVLADVLFCVALMGVGSRAAVPDERNRIMTELVPFSLVSSAGVGFAMGLGISGAIMVVALMAAWSLAVLPDVTLKLGSDLLGFALWYVVAMLIAGELRRLSKATAHAQNETEVAWARAVEQEREAESLRQREIAHREIHDYLLPVVDHVAAGGAPSTALVREARRGAQRARRIIMDPRGLDPRFLHDGHAQGRAPGRADGYVPGPGPSSGSGSGSGDGRRADTGYGGSLSSTPGSPGPGAAATGTGAGVPVSLPVQVTTRGEGDEVTFEAMMSAVVDTFTDEGLALVPFLGIEGEPPEPVREALVAATREALRNVIRHAGQVDEVSLFVEGGADAMLVVVRDRGLGFDPATVRPGGGLAGSYRALERHGGRVDVSARPGLGVKVIMCWPAPPDGPSRPDEPSEAPGELA
ncbi:ATP-binding protein [Frankia sp. AiPa1]|uniref:sensor histidine kinase n=1 Tax=Frankia sp. AiPa1 TaxID=573492 RepID=UPI00202B0AA7|nr:ATP-binding protein [Frankia sp. AiPa1]MCL9761994.1 ATP-binding protein [Frankia sp. AiPa1]